MKKHYFSMLLSLCCLLMSVWASGQVQYKIALLPDGITYRVTMKPSVTWLPPFNITSSAQVSVKVPHGGLTVTNLTSLVSGTSWANNANYPEPAEAPGFDYFNFGMTSLGTNAFTYSAGVELHLFTFQNSGTCLGAIDLVEANDPFYPPNSQSANVGNQLTTLGGGVGVNAWSSNYETGNSNCLTCTLSINSVSSGNPTDCNLNNGTIVVGASGTGSIEYSIDNGTNWHPNGVFGSLAPGTYQVRVKNPNCTVIYGANPVVLAAPQQPSMSISGTNPSVCNGTDGSLTVTASGGTGMYQFSKDGGANWQSTGSFTNLGGGTYQMKVRNSNGSCATPNAAVTLTAPACPPPATCPVTYTLEILPNGSYQVSLISHVNWASPQNVTSSSQVTVVAPHGGFSVTNLTNLIPGVTYSNNANYPAPTENPTKDYFIFGLTSPGATGISYQNGLKVPLFTFSNGTACSGNAISLMAVTGDAFEVPNSESANVGQQLSTLGGGQDIPLCIAGGMVACVPCGVGTPDADSDGICDNLENLQGSDPNNPCNPDNTDTDEDGFCDQLEDNTGTDDLNSCDPDNTDTDGDGFCDLWENFFGTDPNNPCDPDNSASTCACDEIFAEDTVYIPGGDGDEHYCLGISAADLNFYDVILNGAPYTQPSTFCAFDTLYFYTYAFTVGQGNAGPYIVQSWSVNGQTFSGVVADMNDLAAKMNIWDPAGNWVNNPSLNAISGGLDGYGYGSMKLRHIATNVPTLIQINYTYIGADTRIELPGEGTHQIVIDDPLSGCSDTVIVITVNPTPDDLTLVTPYDTPTTPTCLTSNQLPGTVSSISSCGQPAHGTVTFTQPNCFSYDPVPGFWGTDEFCVVICNSTTPQFCDTTYVTVNVGEPNCEEVFGQDTLFALLEEAPIEVCVGISQADIAITQIRLDNQLMTNLSNVCAQDTLLFYSYAFVVGQGNSGPYLVQSWVVNGITYSGVVANMNALAAQMNAWNPGGNWVNVPGSATINGGTDTDFYGNMKLVHIQTLVPTTVQPNYTLVGDGVQVDVNGEGTHQLVVYNPNTGCSDTLIVVIIDPVKDTLVVITEPGEPTIQICLPTNELSGPIDNVSLCSLPDDGSVDILPNNCIIFTPNPGFSGEAEFCVIACDGNVLPFCDTTIIVVVVPPVTDTIVIVIDPEDPEPICPQLAGGQPVVITNQTTCENEPNFQVIFNPNTGCFILNPDDDFAGAEEICIIQCYEGPITGIEICDTTIFIVTVPPHPDTVDVTLTSFDPHQLCLDNPAVLQLPGTIVSATLCGVSNNNVAVTLLPNGCLSLDPLNGLNSGTTQICVIHCNNGVPQLCDTTIIHVTIDVPCDDIFGGADTIYSAATQVCAPLALSQWSLYDIVLDGAPYNYPPVGCAVDTLIFYSYAFTVGQGNAGPYKVTWFFNGATHIANVMSAAALVNQMNVWNPGGNWTLHPGSSSISGGAPGATYGSMVIRHIFTNIPTTVLPNLTEVAYGTTIQVGTPGIHTIVAVDPNTGCTDTLVVVVIDITPDYVFVTTPEGVPTAPICLDLTELPGNPVSVLPCSAPAHGTVSVGLNYCAVYTPAPGFAGEDRFCLVVCDDYNPQYCDTTFITVLVQPSNDQVNVTIPPTNPTVICLDAQLDGTGTIVSVNLCNTPQNVAVTLLPNGCVSINPLDGWGGYTDVCVQHCYAGQFTGQIYCETTTIHVTVTPPTDTVTVTIPNGDPITHCLGTALDLPGTIVSASVCGENPAQVDATPQLNGCVLLDPAFGFDGTSQICVIYCNNGSPQLCDTTIILVTVDLNCPVIFPEDTIYTEASKICVPIPLAEIDIYQIILDGADYLYPPTPCNEETLVFYTYSFTIGSGLSGPYNVSWNVNGMTHSGTVATMNALAAWMNTKDPLGAWVNNPTSSSVSGGDEASDYSTMILTHQQTGVPAILLPNYTDIALGSCVQLGEPGWHELIVINGNTGCADTVYVFVSGNEINVSAKVLLQGAYNINTLLMNDNLRQLNFVPTSQPYAALPHFNHNGGETTTAAVLAVTSNNAIVDWVLLELRDAINPHTVLSSRAALVQKDGDIVDTDGVSPVQFDIANGNYYLAVRHRNHLGAMTATPLAMSVAPVTMDFTSTATSIYGTSAMKLMGTKRVLWAGNANGDHKLVFQGDVNDADAVFFKVIVAPGNASNSPNFIVNGYSSEDCNMDGKTIFQGASNDVDFMIFFNVLTHPLNSGFLINYIFPEQLP